MMSKDKRLAAVAIASILATSGAAQAGGFALREQSAIGLGNSFAGAAAGGSGLASMFWNPATMTNFAGMQSSMSLFAIVPYSKITPTTGTSTTLLALGGTRDTGDMAQDAALPSSYSSWQINENVWVGLSVNTPYGLVTQNPNSWSGQIYGRTSKVQSINATPTLGYRFNDQFSVGAGVQIMQFKVRLTSANDVGAAALGPTARNGELKGDDVAFGFTLGATYKPFAGTEIGIGYRSQVKPKLEGSFAAPGGVPSTGLAAGNYDIRSNLTLPDQVTVGLRQRITDDFTMLAGFEWTHWSVFSHFPVTTTSGAAATTLYFDYKNGWFASLGGEYKWSPSWTLRAGVGFEHSPINDTNRSVRLPDSNRIWTSLGASYKWTDKLSFDASYAHLFGKSGSINVVPGNPVLVGGFTFVGSTKARVDIFSVGLTYRWDDPKIAVPYAKPALITKG